MKTRLLHILVRIRGSLWFVPSLLSVCAVVLALGAVRIGNVIDASDERLRYILLYRGGPDGARALLTTVAGSMITVAGVTFSITIVALSLASSQFGPRLLTSFMRDRGNQVVLGTFIATFLFCVVALANGSYADEGATPAVTATIGLVLTVASLAVFIYFIHHVAMSIQADRVIVGVVRGLEEAIDRAFPEGGGPPPDVAEPMEPARSELDDRALRTRRSGYIQAINENDLLELANELDLTLRVCRRPGDFLVEGDQLLVSLRGTIPDERESEFRKCFIIGRTRSPEQDPEYGIKQLVEVAVRALSPSVNDPFTAITCIDWLTATLSRAADRAPRAAFRTGDEDRLRLALDPVTFGGLVDAAFNQIRQYGRSSVPVSIRLLEGLEQIGERAKGSDRRRAVRTQVELVLEESGGVSMVEHDRAALRERHRRAIRALEH